MCGACQPPPPSLPRTAIRPNGRVVPLRGHVLGRRVKGRLAGRVGGDARAQVVGRVAVDEAPVAALQVRERRKVGHLEADDRARALAEARNLAAAAASDERDVAPARKGALEDRDWADAVVPGDTGEDCLEDK